MTLSMKLYWGDIHNHCGVSYGYGTQKRAPNNARKHLKFFTITGHAFFPDMPMEIESRTDLHATGGLMKLQHFRSDLFGRPEYLQQTGGIRNSFQLRMALK